jgi:hypothetical protein
MALSASEYPATLTLTPSTSSHIGVYEINFLFYEYSVGCTDTSSPVTANAAGEIYAASPSTFEVTLDCASVSWDVPVNYYEVCNFEDTEFALSADKILDDDGISWSSVCGQAVITISDTTFTSITGTGSD